MSSNPQELTLGFCGPEELERWLLRAGMSVSDPHKVNLSILCAGAYSFMCDEVDVPALKCPDAGSYVTELVEPTSSKYLRLKGFPIVDVSLVYYDDLVANALAATDFKIWMPQTHQELYHPDGWSDPEYYWNVRYRCGYQASDRQYAALTMIQLMIASAVWKTSGGACVVANQEGDLVYVRANLDKEIANIVESLLAPYRKNELMP